MDSIIKEVNLAYDVLEKENVNQIDAALFAEEHIHSVIDLFSNKDLTEALQLLHQEFFSAIQTEDCIDDMYSILSGSDVGFQISEEDLYINKDRVAELEKAIQKEVANGGKSFILQFGPKGNHQKDVVKIVASRLSYPCMVIHREDFIARFAKECESRVRNAFAKCQSLQSRVKSPVILYIEDIDGMLPNAHASPVEQMKRKLVEKALCEQLNQLSQRAESSSESYPIIVVIDSEFPSTLKNELHSLQSEQILYRVPDEAQRRCYLEHLLSIYDNALSEYAINRLLIHSSAFSLTQLRLLFDHAFFCMLLCKDNAISVDSFDLASVSKASMYQTLSRYIQDRMNGAKPVVPSIPDSVLLALLDKEKPSFSVVDVSRDIDFCKAVSRPDDEIELLNAMTKLLRERDDQIRKRDAENSASASRDPIERRSGEPARRHRSRRSTD
ncbi:uncharacterized protein [Blastocystis hominis]|uniref:ATPase AAA-type core domain-containing protein n=1 Tax=Blastocystis hominis TaxID=12968 RepID=D8M7Y8_BLAHO|nr:uncharacterized protein [Blastocystis hominis]CBK24177.2 unnamed protein product [Blastocystis hominis]|eukprot:XP_012898225.1 uncharacterized protein [Blastocystis hominis]